MQAVVNFPLNFAAAAYRALAITTYLFEPIDAQD
jgi:hypothetical protein